MTRLPRAAAPLGPIDVVYLAAAVCGLALGRALEVVTGVLLVLVVLVRATARRRCAGGAPTTRVVLHGRRDIWP